MGRMIELCDLEGGMIQLVDHKSMLPRSDEDYLITKAVTATEEAINTLSPGCSIDMYISGIVFRSAKQSRAVEAMR